MILPAHNTSTFQKIPTLFFSWVIALIATLGSLFFSEYLKYPPCSLCWWQRIFMYPQMFILFLAFLKDEEYVLFYVLPLTLFGWLIALYHNLIFFKIIEPTLIPCTSGISCTDNQLNYFGFLTIPLMSFIAFSMLLILQIIYKLQVKNVQRIL